MGPLFVKGLAIGAGRPKVCVPVSGIDDAETLILAAEAAADSACELVEWRVDAYAARDDATAVCNLLGQLAVILAEKPLLATVRTAAEGGAYVGDEGHYLDLLEAMARNGADLVDLEIGRCLDAAAAVERLHAAGASVVGSWHDFSATPAPDAVFRHLQEMEEAGCDIAKVACMAAEAKDVAVMRAAGVRAQTMLGIPAIVIGMGEAGVESRTKAQAFGSCISFGTLGVASAPGQIPAAELKAILEEQA